MTVKFHKKNSKNWNCTKGLHVKVLHWWGWRFGVLIHKFSVRRSATEELADFDNRKGFKV